MDVLNTIQSNLISLFKTIRVTDIIDIAIVAIIVYLVIRLVRETRTGQVVKGILILIGAYLVVYMLGLNSMGFILENILSFGVLALLVIFQPELRRGLEQVGTTNVKALRFFAFNQIDNKDVETRMNTIDVICEAALDLSDTMTGALIVCQRDTTLDDIEKTGTLIDAKLSKELLCNIFYPKSPLHDGALILSSDKIKAAGCFLPLSDDRTLSKSLGTRHRAAMGMSENSDAIIVVVSEETGVISVCYSGKIKRNFDRASLKNLLLAELVSDINIAKKSPLRKEKKHEEQ